MFQTFSAEVRPGSPSGVIRGGSGSPDAELFAEIRLPSGSLVPRLAQARQQICGSWSEYFEFVPVSLTNILYRLAVGVPVFSAWFGYV